MCALCWGVSCDVMGEESSDDVRWEESGDVMGRSQAMM